MTEQDEAARLVKLRGLDLLDSAPEPQFDVIAAEAAARAGTVGSRITLVDEHRQWFKAGVAMDKRETPLSESICAHAMRGDEPFVVPDAQLDERFRDIPGVAEGAIRFYAGVPLRLRDGTRLGTLCVFDEERRDGLDGDERLALETLARRTVAAFELRREMRRDAVADPADGIVSEEVWREHAAELLAKAAVALERAGEGEALAHLEQVVALVEAKADDAG